MNLLMRGRGKLIFLVLSSVAVVALAACAGDAGSQGPQGPAGAAGAAGNPGAAGAAGAAGNPGESGLPGEPGAPGNAGAKGLDGTDGTDGTDGKDGRNGVASTSFLIVVDAGTGSAGFIEFKALGTTQANVVGGGFHGSETIILQAGKAVFDSVTANGDGAFSVTIDLPAGFFGPGTVHTLDAIGDTNSVAASGFAITDKVSTD